MADIGIHTEDEFRECFSLFDKEKKTRTPQPKGPNAPVAYQPENVPTADAEPIL